MVLTALALVLLAADPAPPVTGTRPDLSQLSLDEIITRARRSARELGTYRYTVRKRERIGTELTDEETLEMTVREKPYAMRLDVVSGPHSGRKLLFNSEIRPDDFRVRESGPAHLLGAMWIGVHSRIALNGTRHAVTDSGFAHLFDITMADLDRARPFGGRRVLDRGYDSEGRYCIRTAAPEGATGSYAPLGRVCHDPVTFLPLTVEVWDSTGLLESYTYSNILPRLNLDDAYFTPEGAGL